MKGKLYFDFSYDGVRYREHTRLADTPENRRMAQMKARLIEIYIENGTFDYEDMFPAGRRVRGPLESGFAYFWRSYRQRKRDQRNHLHSAISGSVGYSLRSGKGGRTWEALVGFSVEDLMAHLEKQFREEMGWRNYGRWHVDHIRPVSSYEFTHPDDPDFKACWALSNLQPLWAEENWSKGSKFKEY